MVAAYPTACHVRAAVSIDLHRAGIHRRRRAAHGVVFGLAPMLHLSSDLSATALRTAARARRPDGTRCGADSWPLKSRWPLALVVGAGLLFRTVNNLSRVDAGSIARTS